MAFFNGLVGGAGARPTRTPERDQRSRLYGWSKSNRIVISAIAGAAAGAVLGVLAGGVWASCFGQPFSGATGLKVFPAGMWFPGVIVAPVGAGVGAALGAVVGFLSKNEG